MRKTKGFSYDPKKDKDVIDHIGNQPNGSQYVWELVRKDMKENNIETIIKNQIEKYLKDMKLPPRESQEIMDIDTEEIKNILEI